MSPNPIVYTVKVYPNGFKFWYLNGKYHREDGPAVEYSNGDKYWYLNGKRHRVDGPAIEHANGYKAWYLNDKKLTEEEYKKQLSPETSTTCSSKVVEIPNNIILVGGKKYKLVEV